MRPGRVDTSRVTPSPHPLAAGAPSAEARELLKEEDDMKKTVTESVNRTISVCDLCEADRGLQRCWVCQRECCYQCRKLLFAGKGTDLVEFAINVCTKCQEYTNLVKNIQSLLGDTNTRLREFVEVWKKAAKRKEGEQS